MDLDAARGELEDFELGIIDKGIKRWIRNHAMPNFRMQMEDPKQARPDTFDALDNCKPYDNRNSKEDYLQLTSCLQTANQEALNEFENCYMWMWCTSINRYFQRSSLALGLPVLERVVQAQASWWQFRH